MNSRASGILFCFACGDDVAQHRDAGCAQCRCGCGPFDIVMQWWSANAHGEGANGARCAPGMWDFECRLREIETLQERTRCNTLVVRCDGTPIAHRAPGGTLTQNVPPLQPAIARTVRAALPSVFHAEQPFYAVLPPATLTRITALRLPGGRYAAVFIDERERPDVVALTARRYALSHREGEILGLLLAGLPTRAIGEELGIAVGTVRVHAKRLVKKAHAASVHELLNGLTASLAA
jgi:DNA-binding CsgD family transcriptional regulator